MGSCQLLPQIILPRFKFPYFVFFFIHLQLIAVVPKDNLFGASYLTVVVTIAGMPADRVNDPTQLTPGEPLHPRRGDKVYLWVPED